MSGRNVNRDAGGRDAMAVVCSVLGMGVSGAEFMARRLTGVGEAVALIWLVCGLDMVTRSSCVERFRDTIADAPSALNGRLVSMSLEEAAMRKNPRILRFANARVRV